VNPHERRRVERYARTKEWLAAADMAYGAALLALALFTGWSAVLRSAVERITPRFYPAAFGAAGAVAVSVLSLPLHFYGGLIVERRYGLSNQSVGGWIGDWLKGLAISTVLGAPLVQAAYAVITRWPRRWWAVLASLLVPLSVLMAHLGPVLILPLFNRFRPLGDKDLEERIKSLSSREGVSVSRVLQMDMSKQTRKANAFFTGLGNTRRIVLGDTLLAEFTPDEVEVVVAHELGHQVHRDIWKLIALQLPVSLGSFYAMGRLAPPVLAKIGPRARLRGEQGIADPAALPVLALIGTGYSLAATPLINALVRRTVEHPADEYALRLTRNPSAFIGAMEKLGRMNLADPDPPRLVKWLFHNHPTLNERREFARRYGASNAE
jgi:STE24 endopeptidase